MEILAALIGLIGVIVSVVVNSEDAETNRVFTQEENAITREREDNSVQRRREDLDLAGINPILAGLGGASAQPGQIISQNRGGIDLGSLIAGLGDNIPKNVKTGEETKGLEMQNELQSHLQNTLLMTVAEKDYKFGGWVVDKAWEELTEEERKAWESYYPDNMTVAEQDIVNDIMIKSTTLEIQRELSKQMVIDTEIKEQVQELGGVELATNEVMLKMLKKDYEVILQTGPDKAWDRISTILNAITSVF